MDLPCDWVEIADAQKKDCSLKPTWAEATAIPDVELGLGLAGHLYKTEITYVFLLNYYIEYREILVQDLSNHFLRAEANSFILYFIL